ncbi:MAG: KH domain-containing protein [Alphaproteobacteria bacterium]|nr:KH domain-containing protein [Alphaproteobacteria bacterium]
MNLDSFVTFLVKGLVDNPESVKVSKVEGDASVMLELYVDSDDAELVAGENGETLQHLRAVVAAASGRRKAILELMDGESEE